MNRFFFTFALALLLPMPVRAQSASIDVPAGQQPVLTAEGRGVQIYRCDQKANVPAWVFVAPEAQLFVHGVLQGTHGAGPMWTLNDGSSVHGKAIATKPSPDARAIPWLLIQATETAGKGTLTPVSFIRRTETRGGQAASTGCDAAHLGATDRVPYTATYTFYAPVK